MLELDTLRRQIGALTQEIAAKTKIRDEHREEFRNETFGTRTLSDQQYSVLQSKVDNQSLAIARLKIELNRLRNQEGELEKKPVNNVITLPASLATTPRHSPAA